MTNPVFDDFDAGILSERERNRLALSGPQVGDYVGRKDGRLARITNLWEAGVQTTEFSASGDSGSFYLSRGGKMDYSGSMEQSLPLTHLRESRDKKKGKAWFFHHDSHAAHNGVSFETSLKVFDLLTDSEVRDKTKPARWIVSKGVFKGHTQSSTYTTLDGVERVAYRNGQTLEDYLKVNPGMVVISDSELDSMLASYHEGLKTDPKPITEQQFMDLLECLPPCRWQNIGGAEVFHVSERYTGNLVQWCAKIGDQCYGFTDDAAISLDDLRRKLDKVLSEKE